MAHLANPRQSSRPLAAWLPPLLWTLGILYLSGSLGAGGNTLSLLKWLLSGVSFLSPKEIEVLHWYLRKLGHLVAYGILYLLWFRALNRQVTGHAGRALKLALLLSLVVALLNEGIQMFYPERVASLADVALDMAGVALAALIFPGFIKPRTRSGGRGTRP